MSANYASHRLAVVCSHVQAGIELPSPQIQPSTTSEKPAPDVLYSNPGTGVATIRLNRVSKLNSLSLGMIRELKVCYDTLVKDKEKTHCVILRGEGRAFCAGGDVQAVQEGILARQTLPADFFYEEYIVDYDVAMLYQNHKILQIAWYDGILMGGGVGLSIFSPIRVCSEKVVYAMPECGIGLFPDVGLTWGFSRVTSYFTGIYLGLTGTRIKAADMVFAGLATHYCPSDKFVEVQKAIEALGAAAGDQKAVSAAIEKVTNGATPDTKGALLKDNIQTIEKCFGNVKTVEEILQRLDSETSDFAKTTAATLRTKSPTSMKVTLEAILRHHPANVDLRTALVTEYRISQGCMRKQPYSDFVEGIRAVLVDKDNKPKWNPARLEDVSPEHVQTFFDPLPKGHARGELPL